MNLFSCQQKHLPFPPVISVKQLYDLIPHTVKICILIEQNPLCSFAKDTRQRLSDSDQGQHLFFRNPVRQLFMITYIQCATVRDLSSRNDTIFITANDYEKGGMTCH